MMMNRFNVVLLLLLLVVLSLLVVGLNGQYRATEELYTPTPVNVQEDTVHVEEMKEIANKQTLAEDLHLDAQIAVNKTRQIDVIDEDKKSLFELLLMLKRAVEEEARRAEEEYIKQRKETLKSLIVKKRSEVEEDRSIVLQGRAQKITESLKLVRSFKDMTVNSKQLLGRGHLLPALSCKNIKESNPRAQSGIYWIEPKDPLDKKSKTPFRVICHMVAQGGGWTQIAWKKAGVSFRENLFSSEVDRVIMAFEEFRSEWKDQCNIGADRLKVLSRTGFEVYLVEKNPTTGEKLPHTPDTILTVEELTSKLNEIAASAPVENEVSIYIRPM